jgi:hypothetical protein
MSLSGNGEIREARFRTFHAMECKSWTLTSMTNDRILRNSGNCPLWIIEKETYQWEAMANLRIHTSCYLPFGAIFCFIICNKNYIIEWTNVYISQHIEKYGASNEMTQGD